MFFDSKARSWQFVAVPTQQPEYTNYYKGSYAQESDYPRLAFKASGSSTPMTTPFWCGTLKAVSGLQPVLALKLLLQQFRTTPSSTFTAASTDPATLLERLPYCQVAEHS